MSSSAKTSTNNTEETKKNKSIRVQDSLFESNKSIIDIKQKLQPVLQRLKDDKFGQDTDQAHASVALSIGMIRYMGARLQGLDQGRQTDDPLRKELNNMKRVLAEIKKRKKPSTSSPAGDTKKAPILTTTTTTKTQSSSKTDTTTSANDKSTAEQNDDDKQQLEASTTSDDQNSNKKKKEKVDYTSPESKSKKQRRK